ncbi:hypothetical protein [Parabacteroides hominis]|nr:hypothetical protein [Parabacteroides hominis]
MVIILSLKNNQVIKISLYLHHQIKQTCCESQQNRATDKYNKNMTKTPIKTRVCIKDTLLSIPVGETIVIERKDITDRSVVYSATRLNKKGYKFKTSVAGRIDSIAVTRLK